jgi:hypothetical protein
VSVDPWVWAVFAGAIVSVLRSPSRPRRASKMAGRGPRMIRTRRIEWPGTGSRTHHRRGGRRFRRNVHAHAAAARVAAACSTTAISFVVVPFRRAGPSAAAAGSTSAPRRVQPAAAAGASEVTGSVAPRPTVSKAPLEPTRRRQRLAPRRPPRACARGAGAASPFEDWRWDHLVAVDCDLVGDRHARPAARNRRPVEQDARVQPPRRPGPARG